VLAVAVTLVLFLLSGVALAGALILSRRRRIDLDRRVMLVVPSAIRAGEMGALAQREGARDWDERLRRLFTFGLVRTWGMTTGAKGLLIICGIAAAAGWLLVHVALGFSAFVALPLTAIVAIAIPRAVIVRQQKKRMLNSPTCFPISWLPSRACCERACRLRPRCAQSAKSPLR
jgi:Flp pilus assembly protein TadB